MRRDRLCPSPRLCPEALTPEAQQNVQEVLPCEECPAEKLALYLVSPSGQWMSVVVDLDFALQSRIQVPLSQISYLDFLLLRLLADERNKFQVEEIEKQHQHPIPRKHGR